MKLRKLHIQNFRGIKDLELDLADLVVLIGENNTGKTAILQALRLCLRELSPRGRLVFDPFDFHLKDDTARPNTADPIVITLTFSEDKEGDWNDLRVRRLGDIIQVSTTDLRQVVLQVTCTPNSVTGEPDQTWDFLTAAGQPQAQKRESHLGALQREVVFYLLDALRDATRNFDAKGPYWRPFLKDDQLSDADRETIESQLAAVNETVVTRHSSFEQVRDRLKKLQYIVPMQGGNVASIEAVPGRLFDLLSKAQVHLGTTTGAKVPVVRHGEGTQSLAVLMLFAAFLDHDAATPGKNSTPLVALEEPEAHLHPAAVRTLWKTIGEVPGQKFISTHSGDLLSQVPVSAVRRLARVNGGVQCFRLGPNTLKDPKDQRMFDFHIRHARGELLFARCWLLGEGETEVTLFHEIARHLGIDLEQAGVRCVPYRLGASIELFLKVARDFGIRWCVLTDNDDQGKSDQKHVTDYTDSKLLTDSLHIMTERDIEHHLCVNGFGHVYQAIYDNSPQLQSPQPLKPPCSQCGHAPKSRPRLTAAQGSAAYWPELLKVIKNSLDKPGTALEVIQEIQGNGKAVPPLIEMVIRKAVELAEGA